MASHGAGDLTDRDPGAGATLGQALRAAREAAGLSVEQVSAATRIRATLVRDLEDDRVESSGGTVYARGHVRNIANAVGADAAALVAQFDSQVRPDSSADGPPHGFGGTPATRPPVAAEPARPDAGSLSERVLGIGGLGTAFRNRPERRGPNWAVAGVAAIAVLVTLIVLGNLNGKPVPTVGADALGLGPPSPSAAPPVEPSAAPQQLAPAAVAQLPATGDAQLRIRTVGGASWIRVRNATSTLYEGVLPDGTTKDFKDPKELQVVVGNAGAVNLVCSGKDLGPVGGRGQIGRFTCSAAGLVPA